MTQIDKIAFFAWCTDHGLIETRDIADAFRISDQTVRNWARHVAEWLAHVQSEPAEINETLREELSLEYWVELAIEMFDHYIGSARGPGSFNAVPKLGAMLFSDLKKWQNRHGLSTYKAVADKFHIQRQAVHNWHSREKYPRWLPLACEAINLRKPAKSGKSAPQVA